MGFEPSQADITAIKERTDLIPDAPATEGTSAAIQLKTDNLPATPADETTVAGVDTKATAIQGKTDNLPASPANETTSASIKTQTDKIPNITHHLKLASTFQTPLTLTAVATTTSLPSITIADLPSGATVVRAVANFIARDLEEDSGSANYINGAQTIQAQKAVGGTWTTAISIVSGQMRCPADSHSTGPVLLGASDISAQIPGNGAVVSFRWLSAAALAASLYIRDVQIVLEIDYTM